MQIVMVGFSADEMTHSFSQVHFGAIEKSDQDLERILYVKICDRNMIECPLVIKLWDSNHSKSLVENINLKVMTSPFELTHEWRKAFAPMPPNSAIGDVFSGAYEMLSDEQIFEHEERHLLLANIKNLYASSLEIHEMSITNSTGSISKIIHAGPTGTYFD